MTKCNGFRMSFDDDNFRTSKVLHEHGINQYEDKLRPSFASQQPLLTSSVKTLANCVDLKTKFYHVEVPSMNGTCLSSADGHIGIKVDHVFPEVLVSEALV